MIWSLSLETVTTAVVLSKAAPVTIISPTEETIVFTFKLKPGKTQQNLSEPKERGFPVFCSKLQNSLHIKQVTLFLMQKRTALWTAMETVWGLTWTIAIHCMNHYLKISILEAISRVSSNCRHLQPKLKVRITFSNLMFWMDGKSGLNTEHNVKSSFPGQSEGRKKKEKEGNEVTPENK